MVSQEDIDKQQQLLATYRRSLAHLLNQQAQFSAGHVPAHLNHGIVEARGNIARIKDILHSWDVVVKDEPNDIETHFAFLSKPAPGRNHLPHYVVLLLSILAFIFIIAFISARVDLAKFVSIAPEPTQLPFTGPRPTIESAIIEMTSITPDVPVNSPTTPIKHTATIASEPKQLEPTPTPTISANEVITTATAEDTSTIDPDKAGINDVHCSSENLCISLVQYFISEYAISISFKIINNGNSSKLVRYRNSSIEVADDTGYIYTNYAVRYTGVKQYQLGAGESITISSQDERFSGDLTDQFKIIGYYMGEIGENTNTIYVDVLQFMGISNIRWSIPLSNSGLNQLQQPSDGLPIQKGGDYQGNGLSIRLDDYQIIDRYIVLKFTIRNIGDENMLVRYRNTYIEVSDDTGAIYNNYAVKHTGVKRLFLESGSVTTLESQNINFSSDQTYQFHLIGYYTGSINENVESIYVNISRFMGMKNLKWEIKLN